jgi:hypothetical protein
VVLRVDCSLLACTQAAWHQPRVHRALSDMKRIASKPPAQTADTQCVRQRQSESESTARVPLFDMAPIAKRIRAVTEERWMMDEAELASSSNWGSMNACYFEKHLLDSIIAGNYHMTLRSRR